jgi:hypothetical protein
MSINPLCCQDAIPMAFQHLLELTPSGTVHNNRPISCLAGPLIASLISCIITEDAIPPALLPGSPLPYPSLFYAVVEVVTLRPTGTQRTHSSSPGFTTISPPAREDIVNTTISTKYFVPIEERSAKSRTILAPNTYLKRRRWREIRKEEAYDTVRRSQMNIVIGDGETWLEMNGVEKLWCEKHGLFMELRAWVRDD